MGTDLSLKQRFALLPRDVRETWLEAQPTDVLEQIARGEWWWTARPGQIPPDNIDAFVFLALAGRGWGKLMTLTTLVPSCLNTDMLNADVLIPNQFGFNKLADLKIGDWVLDEAGKPCRITNVFDAIPQKAYRLTFSDGATVDVCDEHQWVTWTHRDRKAYLRSEYVENKTEFPADWPNWRALSRGRGTTPRAAHNAPGPRMRTTQEIVDTLTYGARGDTNHCIPVATARTPSRNLPIDPWVLGYWLGNGDSRGGALTCHLRDTEFVAERVASCGFLRTVTRIEEKGQSRIGTSGLMTTLRSVNLLSNKHVPTAYLWGSVGQRKALLAGLMDSDGYCEDSKVEFSSTRRELADAVLHLARSLGQVPTLFEGVATLHGEVKGPKFRVSWRPSFNPFTSPRKAAKYVPPASQALRTKHRMIVSAEPIAPVPMRCLTVDSPNSMFLITEAFIPTHNSRAGSEWLINRIQKHPYDSHGVPTEWLVIAETLGDARSVCLEGPAGILRSLDRQKIVYKYVRSPRPMILFPDGQKIYCEGGNDPDVGRGYNAAGAWLDEIAKWVNANASWYEGIMPSLRAPLVDDHPRAFVTTTPKPDKLLQDWLARKDGSIYLMSGSTFDNASNLSAAVIAELKNRYEGTNLGLQELYGQMLEAMDGALFKRTDIEKYRVDTMPDNIASIAVGVDPSLTDEGDEMGCVVMARSTDNHLYCLEDNSTMAAGRDAALHCWKTLARWGADVLVIEENLGKRWMQQVFRDAYFELVGAGEIEGGTTPPMNLVDARVGKRTRGEPVAMRMEQGKLHHVGKFDELEDQLSLFTGWDGKESPDRLDAYVHAARFLMKGEKRKVRFATPLDYVPRLDVLDAY